MGPSFCTTSGAVEGRGVDTTAARCGGCCGGSCCWPSGAGTTVPGCARGSGAGAVGRWAAGVEGQGGSGVLPQAVSSRAARVAEVAQRMARKEAVTGRAVSVPAGGVRRRGRCMVMGVLPMDASLGGVCAVDVTCAVVPSCIGVHPVAMRWLTQRGAALWAKWSCGDGYGGDCGVAGGILSRSSARTNPWSDRVRSRPSCRWSLK